MSIGFADLMIQYRPELYTKKGTLRKLHPNKAALTDEQRAEIKRRAPHEQYASLANEFGVSQRAIYRMCGPKRQL